MLPTETKQLLAGPASYNISNSLRFRASASAYLNRTPASTTNTTIWTLSVWVKRGTITAAFPIDNKIIDANGNTRIYFNTSDQLEFDSGGAARIVTSSVYRDPSAWYHVVFVCNTVAGTQTFYVNGVQVTALSTNAPLTGSATTSINSNTSHVIGKNGAAAYYADFYLAEYNLIDGQALTPSNFGAYNPYTGVWSPQRYTGSYTGNSFYLPFINQASSTFAATFNGSTQYLTTNVSAGSVNLALGTSDFTVEYWMNTTTAVSGATLCCAGSGTVSYDGLFGYITAGTLVTYLSSTGSSWDIASNRTIISTITTGRWYHIAFTRSGSTWRVFVDGTQVDTFTSSASLYQSANQFSLARAQGTGYFTGLLSNVRVIKGTALYTSNFTPPIQPLTAVTNTQLLTLQNSTIIDNSVNNFGITNNGTVAMSAATPFTQPDLTADYSGLGNNWTPNNISLTAGVTYDSMIDVPTPYYDGGNGRGNYCVVNPLSQLNSSTVANGNLTGTVAAATATSSLFGTIAIPSGAYYWETTFTSRSGNNAFAIGALNNNQVNPLGSVLGTGCASIYSNNGNFYLNGAAGIAYASAFDTGTVVGIALDATNATINFYINGVAQGQKTIASGGLWTPAWGNGTSTGNQVFDTNFGQRPFSGTIPSGFKALQTLNLPAPTIANGANYMAATTYTGTGGATSISNQTNSGNNPLQVPMQPDFVWIKARTLSGSNPGNHTWWDTVRGVAGGFLMSNSTNGTGYDGNGLSAFNANGWSMGLSAGLNNLNDTFVGWQWQAGTAPTVDNSAGAGNIPTAGSVKINGADLTSALSGSIAATRLSANTSAGFSVITYTGTGANATVGHGLGAAPQFVIIKTRSPADWYVGHTSVGWSGTGYLILNNTGAAGQYGSLAVWQTTAPNSTVITLGTTSGVNANGGNYVCYAWAPITGFSSFGTYTGNGLADGPFIFTGFRPRWIMGKCSSAATSDWFIYDTSRSTYNASTARLYADTAGAETTGLNIDILSNGFKFRASGGQGNDSGATYIYAAFAENPFKYSLAR